MIGSVRCGLPPLVCRTYLMRFNRVQSSSPLPSKSDSPSGWERSVRLAEPCVPQPLAQPTHHNSFHENLITFQGASR